MNYIQALNKIGQIIVEEKFGKLEKVQIKATYIKNDSTNNSLDSIKNDNDFLMIVVFENPTNNPKFLCFNKEEVAKIKGDNEKISISESDAIKPELLKYEVKEVRKLKEKLGIK